MSTPPQETKASERRAMLADVVRGVLIGGLLLALTLPPIGWALQRVHPHSDKSTVAKADPVGAGNVQAADVVAVRVADFRGASPQPAVQRIADWIASSRDNRALPFAILDKTDARVYVFDADAQLIDNSPVLLGGAVGDDSVAGIGERPIEHVLPQERTTPAGRFVSQPGQNAIGEKVVWVDYGAAVSMHRVRLTNPQEHRLERLATPTPDDNRISYGCINVPVAFFDRVVEPVLAQGQAVVYVLPETRPLEAVFAMDALPAQAAEGSRDVSRIARSVTNSPQ